MANADVGELRFVDHVETIILSPQKEVISPTKSPLSPNFPFHNGGGVCENKGGKEAEGNESKNSDSGLDSSNDSSESTNNKGADDQALDDANNNSNVAGDVRGGEVANTGAPRGSKSVNDVYLGKEVALHGTESETINRKMKADSNDKTVTSQATMAMYWYSDNNALNVDLEEIEAFKTSQDDQTTRSSPQTASTTSENGYYQAKNLDSKAVHVINDGNQTSNDANQTQRSRESKSWSPAFESASSRILDLASELKSEPQKGRVTSEVTVPITNSVRDNVEKLKSSHPWGLQREEQVVSDRKEEAPADSDVLPDIESFHTEAHIRLESSSGSPYTQQTSTDEVDAVGMMEARMRIEQSIITPSETVARKHPEVFADESDAVGLMERKDKPIEPIVASTEQSVNAKSPISGAKLNKDDSKNKDSSAQSVESQIVQDAGQTRGVDVPDGIKGVEKKAAAKKEQAYDPFNVRRTYKISDNSENLIQDNGGIFIETETIVDEYLDDADFTLTLKDCWLRLRNKKFEMKVNAAFGCGTEKTHVLTSETEIQEILHKLYSEELDQKRRVSERHLDVLVDSLGLVEFATFKTTRRHYQVGTCTVTLDLSKMGFQAGEVKMMANKPHEIPATLNAIEKVAADLGFQRLQNV